jgi:hypothetical protein
LEFYQAAPDTESLKKMIESIERDIASISALPDKDALHQFFNAATSHEQLYLDLLDFRETRLRQLVDTLKNRIRTAEQRLESASVVIDQYGSIPSLLDRVKLLQEENERFKVRKHRFSVDSLLKPRRMTRCEPSDLIFLVALQNELSIVKKVNSTIQIENEESNIQFPDESELFYETLLNSKVSFSAQLPELVHNPLKLTKVQSHNYWMLNLLVLHLKHQRFS